MFRKSSFCHTGGCVEVDTEFVKSSFSGAECCVEVGAGFVNSSACHSGDCVEVGAGFVKATVSAGQGACVEVGADFVKATRSWGHGDCVEVAADAKADSSCGPPEIVVRVRDSKQRDAQGNHNGPVLEFTMAEWDAFLAGMDAGPNCEFRVVPPGGGSDTGGNAPVNVGRSIGVACP